MVNGRCRYYGTCALSLPETTGLPAAVRHAVYDAGMLSGRPQLQPSFSLHVEFGGGAATVSGHGIAFQQKVPLTRHMGFEVRATAFCTLMWHCISQLLTSAPVALLLPKPEMSITCYLYTKAVLRRGHDSAAFLCLL